MTLVEVLVALVLISVGLLGVAALHVTSLRGNQESYARSQAVLLAAGILERMRANQIAFAQYEVGLNGTGDEGAGATVLMDLTAWQTAIDQALPGGAAVAGGIIDCTGNIATVTIQWIEREEQATSRTRATQGEVMSFRVRSEI